MNSRKFEIFCIIVLAIIIIIIAVAVAYTYYEINNIKKYRIYNESELDSAITYLGLEVCTIIDGTPYFFYGDKKYEVISFAKAKKGK